MSDSESLLDVCMASICEDSSLSSVKWWLAGAVQRRAVLATLACGLAPPWSTSVYGVNECKSWKQSASRFPVPMRAIVKRRGGSKTSKLYTSADVSPSWREVAGPSGLKSTQGRRTL